MSDVRSYWRARWLQPRNNSKSFFDWRMHGDRQREQNKNPIWNLGIGAPKHWGNDSLKRYYVFRTAHAAFHINKKSILFIFVSVRCSIYYEFCLGKLSTALFAFHRKNHNHHWKRSEKIGCGTIGQELLDREGCIFARLHFPLVNVWS